MESECTKERITPNKVPKWDLSIHIARYAFARECVADRCVLDCACGVGYGSHTLALGGAKKVVGVDISMSAVEFAHRNYTLPNLMFTVQDAEHLGFCMHAFDVIVSFETLEHLDSPDSFLSYAVALLKPGGTFIASVPNRTALFLDNDANHGMRVSPFHKHEFDLAEFKALLSRFFENISFYYQLCPDRKFVRARQLNRLARRTRLIRMKSLLPHPILETLRRFRNWLGEQENRKVKQDYFEPRALRNENPPEDAFVLIAMCKKPFGSK